ncbi:ABC-type branched-chain amino acid transport system, ATPase component [Tranquillimonas alkanivorans]|uniref:ABC-type branched-chain amino acid transport system, ATPase component n=1 Tax=Tranquillimonas alkanivorans TaxID=441119 RepID=A0A1I5WGB9_9RHOB|nr:ABC-type branched-chain amino acid transport system, ATPase component [Tranquillimonas alkanivorans]
MQAHAHNSSQALVIEGLVRRFGALVAVDGVDLSIPAGQRRAVLGANGAGKTTLFNMIAGDLPPSEGRITVFGEDMTKLSPEKRVLKGVRRTYQKSLVFGGLSVRENLYVAVRGATGPRLSIWRSAPAQPDWERVAELAERVQLTRRLDEPASELSHGEQRQLELGMALAHPPRLLLLDEPAAGLSMRVNCPIRVVQVDC